MRVESRSFLTNHARVLLLIAQDPGARLRDTAASLGITERSTPSILTDLTAAGYVVKQKDGRRNRYQIQAANGGLDNPRRAQPGTSRPAFAPLTCISAQPIPPRSTPRATRSRPAIHTGRWGTAARPPPGRWWPAPAAHVATTRLKRSIERAFVRRCSSALVVAAAIWPRLRDDRGAGVPVGLPDSRRQPGVAVGHWHMSPARRPGRPCRGRNALPCATSGSPAPTADTRRLGCGATVARSPVTAEQPECLRSAGIRTRQSPRARPNSRFQAGMPRTG
jgi:hypothetical protein